MRQPILSHARFAELFNRALPGAYRKIDNEDVRDMTKCGLIGRYGYYGRSDIEIVRAVLQYEKLRMDREQQANAIRTCKRCGATLTDSNGVGRPKEYCGDCEPFGGMERWQKWYQRKKNLTVERTY